MCLYSAGGTQPTVSVVTVQAKRSASFDSYWSTTTLNLAGEDSTMTVPGASTARLRSGTRGGVPITVVGCQKKGLYAGLRIAGGEQGVVRDAAPKLASTMASR